MIVGTAGHVDHGKTTLVRALTGVDTDRLKEEKARGISIELGYAYTPLPGGGVLGVVDVPGHERFVHTMAAGAAGLDHALLVVAADDGVMPQTREHLAIVQLLGVRCVTPVLTKIDRVPGERVAQVRAEVAALVDAAGLALLLGPTRAGTHGGAGVRELPLAQDDVLLLSDAAWETAARQVLDALERFHAASPDEPGVNAARLRRMAGLTSDGGAGDALWRGVLDALLRDGAVAAGGAWLHLPSHASALSAEDEALAARLLARLSSGPVDPPWVRELAAREGLPEERVRALMRRLARQGRAWQVVKDLFFAPSALQSLAATLAGLASTAGRAGVRAVAFKEATGLGRKRAIQVLEFLDRTGVTRRIGDARIVIAEPAFDAPREPAARP